MDSTIKLILFISCFLISLVCAFLLINVNSYIIVKSEWNCTKSLMVDENNVDRVTCIEYRKVTNDED